MEIPGSFSVTLFVDSTCSAVMILGYAVVCNLAYFEFI